MVYIQLCLKDEGLQAQSRNQQGLLFFLMSFSKSNWVHPMC